jgi:hypothetical protein
MHTYNPFADIKRLLAEQVNEDWFDHSDTFTASKKGKPISYEVAKEDGVTDTLEGGVRHMKGHHIITGPKGEKYPVAPGNNEEGKIGGSRWSGQGKLGRLGVSKRQALHRSTRRW